MPLELARTVSANGRSQTFAVPEFDPDQVDMHVQVDARPTPPLTQASADFYVEVRRGGAWVNATSFTLGCAVTTQNQSGSSRCRANLSGGDRGGAAILPGDTVSFRAARVSGSLDIVLRVGARRALAEAAR